MHPRHKNAPRVRHGKVQTKHNHTQTSTDRVMRTSIGGPGWSCDFEIDYPGAGFRHVLDSDDIERFARLVPGFAHHVEGLKLLRLAAGNYRTWGIYYSRRQIIDINAWERDRFVRYTPHDLEFPQDRLIVDIFNLPKVEEDGKVFYQDELSEDAAKAYILMDVLLHEIGHHVDCMQTRKQRDCPGTEPFANQFAHELTRQIWRRVFREFKI